MDQNSNGAVQHGSRKTRSQSQISEWGDQMATQCFKLSVEPGRGQKSFEPKEFLTQDGDGEGDQASLNQKIISQT